ncbi:hypothetical protein [Sphingobium xenophagum]
MTLDPVFSAAFVSANERAAATDHDAGCASSRVAGVEVIDREPVELRSYMSPAPSAWGVTSEDSQRGSTDSIRHKADSCGQISD